MTNNSNIRRSHKNRNKRNRHGVAAVEFAVIAPVIVLIFFGSISVINSIRIQNNATQIAYMAATQVTTSDEPFNVLESHFEALATTVGLVGADLSLVESDQDIVRVRVTVPAAGNTPIPIASPSEFEANCFAYRNESQ